MKTKVFRTATSILCLALSVTIMYAQNNDSPKSVSLLRKVESRSDNTNSAQSVQLVMGIKSGISESTYKSYINNRYKTNLEKRRKPGTQKKASNSSTGENLGTENGYTKTYEDPDLYFSPVEGDITKQSDGALYYCLQGGDKIYKFKIAPCFFKAALYQVTLKSEYMKSTNAKDIVNKMNRGFAGKGYSAQQSNRDGVTVFVKGNLKATVTLKSEGIFGSSVYIDYSDARMAERKEKADKAKQDADIAHKKEIKSRNNQHKAEGSKSVSTDLF